MDEIKHVITASSSRKHERMERAKAEDFDADERELLDEENEQEEEVFDQVSYCHRHAIMCHLVVVFSGLF